MSDIVSRETRSRMMSGIHGKDTKPEIFVRKALFASGFRFRLHRRELPGIPDIVLPGKKVAIFVHGCFWHLHEGCKNAKLPSTRPEFWRDKLGRNAARDKKNVEALLNLGWRVLVVWECATRNKASSESLPVLLSQWIETEGRFGEFPPNVSAT